MATMNTNVNYISVAGTEVSAYYSEISYENTRDLEDISTGTGTEWIENAPKLGSFSGSMVISVDDTDFDTYKGLFDTAATSASALIFILGGQIAGNPKFEADVFFTSVSVEQSVEKNRIDLDISFEGSGAPTSLFEGSLAGTYTV